MFRGSTALSGVLVTSFLLGVPASADSPTYVMNVPTIVPEEGDAMNRVSKTGEVDLD